MVEERRGRLPCPPCAPPRPRPPPARSFPEPPGRGREGGRFEGPPARTGFAMQHRSAAVTRDTKETRVEVALDLDGAGAADLATGVPFLDHMLDQVARHGLVDLEIRAEGDLEIDAHHTVEDTGIVLGQAVAEALGDKRGILRYGHAYVPLDEALSRVVLDFSGRPGLHYRVEYPRARVGDFDVDLVREFFQGFVNAARATLHVDSLHGRNAHHVAETVFKAFGRALRMAAARDERHPGAIPSTKGVL